MRATFFLPRTPDFYLCPKIPGGGPVMPRGARGLLPPPVYATVGTVQTGTGNVDPARKFKCTRLPVLRVSMESMLLESFAEIKNWKSSLYFIDIYDYTCIWNRFDTISCILVNSIIENLCSTHLLIEGNIYKSRIYMDNVLILFMILNKWKLFIEHYEHNVHQTNENY